MLKIVFKAFSVGLAENLQYIFPPFYKRALVRNSSKKF